MAEQDSTPVSPGIKIALPGSQGILILGIFSLVTTVCCGGIGFIGLVLGIIAVAMAPKAIHQYEQNPGAYTESSIKNVNTGKICGIIGICLNGLMILVAMIYLLAVGAGLATFFSTFPWENYIN